MLARACSGDSPTTSTTPSTSNSPNTVAAPIQSQAAPDPAALLAESRKTVDEIEARVKANDLHLKKYYATPEQVRDATADLIKLGVVKGLYDASKAKDEKKLSARAEALAAKVSMQQRTLYASTMEQIFVKSGLDIQVTAGGAKKDQLRLRYVLMSKPLVYKFQNEMKMDEQARAFGFKKLVFSDGYDETWTIEL